MQFNLLSLLGISLAAMFFGYFFGLFEGRSQGYKKRKNEDPVQPKSSVPAISPLPISRIESLTEHILLSLSLDGNQQTRLDLDGKRVDTSQLATEQRTRLTDLVSFMRSWVGEVSSAGQLIQPTTTTSTQMFIPPQKPSTFITPDLQTVTPEVKPTTMVGQIDAILQSHILGTPLASKGVKLIESGTVGVVVMVVLNRFQGIDEVPDPDVQAAIRSAIAEWEKKYTPS